MQVCQREVGLELRFRYLNRSIGLDAHIRAHERPSAHSQLYRVLFLLDFLRYQTGNDTRLRPCRNYGALSRYLFVGRLPLQRGLMLDRIIQILILLVVVLVVNRYLISKHNYTMLLFAVVLFSIIRNLHIVSLLKRGLQLLLGSLLETFAYGNPCVR